MTTEYRRLVVIGEKKVGKSSILSAAICGSFSENYAGTESKITRFYDVEHGLEFIDTPGVEPQLLMPRTQSSIQTLPDKEKFQQDTLVRELLMDKNIDKRKVSLKLDEAEIHGFVIVYSDSISSYKMALALYECMEHITTEREVYWVKNTGYIEHPCPEAEENWKRIEQEDYAKIKANVVFQGSHGHVESKKVEQNSLTVCAASYDGLDKMLATMASPKSKFATKKGDSGGLGGNRSCETKNCCVM